MKILMFILFFSGIFIWAGIASLAGHFGRKYDHILLKSPNFTPEEKVNYLEFPLHLHKTIIYMTNFTYPSIAKRRFKDIPAPKIELLAKNYIPYNYDSRTSINILIDTIFNNLHIPIQPNIKPRKKRS